MAKVVSNERKLAELILYISQKCADDPSFGSVKLNKILCYSDFIFYAYHQRGITNVPYQKLPNGPAPRKLVPVRNRLIKLRALGMQEVFLKSGRVQRRPVNLRPPQLDVFTAEEIAVVDRVIDTHKRMRADEASRVSHDLVGWAIVEEKETIPYRTIYFANPPLSQDEEFRARELAAKKARESRDPEPA